MALDTRIPLLAQAPTLSDVLSVKESLLKERQLQQQQQDDDAIRSAFQRAQGDPTQASTLLKQQGLGTAAMKLDTQLADIRLKTMQAAREQLDQQKAVTGQIASMLNGLKDHPEQFPTVKARIAAQLGPEAAADLGNAYDQARIQTLINEGLTVQQQNDLNEKALERMETAPKRARQSQQDLATMFAAAGNDEDIQSIKRLALIHGVSRDQLDSIPNVWTPDFHQQMVDASMTPQEAVTEKRNAAYEKHLEAMDKNNTELAEARAQLAKAQADLAQYRAQGGATPGASASAQETTRRQANTWRANQLAALQNKKDQGVVTTTYDPISGTAVQQRTPLSEDQYNAELYRIDSSYRQMLGQPTSPADQPIPVGVVGWLREITAKHPDDYQGALAEIRKGLPRQRELHPHLGPGDVPPEIQKWLAQQYGHAAAPTAPRPGAPTAPTATSTTGRQGLGIGAVVTLKDGRQIRVKAVGPNGNITDYEVLGGAQ